VVATGAMAEVDLVGMAAALLAVAAAAVAPLLAAEAGGTRRMAEAAGLVLQRWRGKGCQDVRRDLVLPGALATAVQIAVAAVHPASRQQLRQLASSLLVLQQPAPAPVPATAVQTATAAVQAASQMLQQAAPAPATAAKTAAAAAPQDPLQQASLQSQRGAVPAPATATPAAAMQPTAPQLPILPQQPMATAPARQARRHAPSLLGVHRRQRQRRPAVQCAAQTPLRLHRQCSTASGSCSWQELARAMSKSHWPQGAQWPQALRWARQEAQQAAAPAPALRTSAVALRPLPVVAHGAAAALRTRPLPQPTASSLVVASFFFQQWHQQQRQELPAAGSPEPGMRAAAVHLGWAAAVGDAAGGP
jgi:hypothetical protein